MAQARRDSIHATMFEVATAMAKRSTCTTKHSVGAVIVRDNRVIATGYNGNLPGQPHCNETGCAVDDDGRCVSSVHAEINALLQCAKYGVATDKAVLYCTLAPCLNCAKAVITAGISTVIYWQTSSSNALKTLLHVGIKVYVYDPMDDILHDYFTGGQYDVR